MTIPDGDKGIFATLVQSYSSPSLRLRRIHDHTRDTKEMYNNVMSYFKSIASKYSVSKYEELLNWAEHMLSPRKVVSIPLPILKEIRPNATAGVRTDVTLN